MKSIGGDELRYELKAEIPHGCFYKVQQLILLSNFKLYSHYPSRKVYNVYFDSVDLRTYRDNLSGASERLKFRYRWYDNIEEYNNGHFEVKRKNGRHSYKTRFDESLSLDIEKTWVENLRHNKQKLSLELDTYLSMYGKATLINEYDRYYYITLDGRLRVTLDRNISVYNQLLDSHVNLESKKLYPECQVMEVKFEKQNKAFAERFMDTLNLKISRYSKYVQGIQTIDELCF